MLALGSSLSSFTQAAPGQRVAPTLMTATTGSPLTELSQRHHRLYLTPLPSNLEGQSPVPHFTDGKTEAHGVICLWQSWNASGCISL